MTRDNIVMMTGNDIVVMRKGTVMTRETLSGQGKDIVMTREDNVMTREDNVMIREDIVMVSEDIVITRDDLSSQGMDIVMTSILILNIPFLLSFTHKLILKMMI